MALDDSCDFIMLQNNDTAFTAPFMSRMVKCMQEKGICGVSPSCSSPLAIQYPESISQFFGLQMPHPDSYGSPEEYAQAVHEQLGDTVLTLDRDSSFIPSFFSMMMPAHVFRRIGLIDPMFKQGYGDDVDFITRMYACGMKVALIPSVYVIHDHHVTFSSLYGQQQMQDMKRAKRIQCMIKNSLSNPDHKRCAVYTCIAGGYDSLKEYPYLDHSLYDYICFTDSPMPDAPPYWKVIDISAFKPYLGIGKENITKLARFFKTNPHLFLQNYEYSLWIDGNLTLLPGAQGFTSLLDDTGDWILLPEHPLRDCVYQQAQACRKLGKDDSSAIDSVLELYGKDCVPEHIGMVQSGIILRRHNDPQCIRMMQLWWDMIRRMTRRDQLCFNYLFWKCGARYLSIPWDQLYRKVIDKVNHSIDRRYK